MSGPTTPRAGGVALPPPPQGPAAATEPHCVLMRVIRMNRPTLVSAAPACPVLCSADVDASAHGVDALVALRDTLSIPTVFGSIAAGVSIRLCINLANSSLADVTRVALRVELHRVSTAPSRASTPPPSPSPPSRATSPVQGATPPPPPGVPAGVIAQPSLVATLVDNTESPIAKMAPAERADFIVQQVIPEPGRYAIICLASYCRGADERSIRKSFNFAAGKALDIRTRTHDTPRGALVEAEIEAFESFFVEDVSFEPSEHLAASPVVAPELPDPGACEWPQSLPRLDRTRVASPGHVLQSLFSVLPKDPNATRVRGELGHVRVAWRTGFGDLGVLYSPPVRFDPAESPDGQQPPLEIRVERSPPARAVVHSPFPVTVRLTNTSGSRMTLRTAFSEEAGSGVVVAGVRAEAVAVDVAPGKFCEASATFLPLRPGIHKLGALRVIDDASGREFTFAGYASVLVDLPEQAL
eukprot:m51a1_g11863 hypothetical protein (470) ;mRNA; r:517092-518610